MSDFKRKELEKFCKKCNGEYTIETHINSGPDNDNGFSSILILKCKDSKQTFSGEICKIKEVSISSAVNKWYKKEIEYLNKKKDFLLAEITKRDEMIALRKEVKKLQKKINGKVSKKKKLKTGKKYSYRYHEYDLYDIGQQIKQSLITKDQAYDKIREGWPDKITHIEYKVIEYVRGLNQDKYKNMVYYDIALNQLKSGWYPHDGMRCEEDPNILILFTM